MFINENKFKKLSFIISVCFLLICINFIFSYNTQAYALYNKLIINQFKQIPYFGISILTYLESNKITDFNAFYQRYFHIIINIDLIWVILPLVISQGIVCIFNYIGLKRNKIIFLVLSLGLTLALMTNIINKISLSSVLAFNLFENFKVASIFVLGLQALLIIKMLVQAQLVDINFNKLVKRIGFGLLLCLMVISGLLSYVKGEINSIQDKVHLSYVVKIKDNKVIIDLDKDVNEKLNEYYIKIPKVISNNDLTKNLKIKDVDLGKYVNDYIDQYTFDPVFSIINNLIVLNYLSLLIIFIFIGVAYLKAKLSYLIIQELLLLYLVSNNIALYPIFILALIWILVVMNSIMIIMHKDNILVRKRIKITIVDK